jgi:hypothetical protein
MVTTWVSSNGNTSVQTLTAATGTVMNAERINYSIQGGDLADQHLDEFPPVREWASSTKLTINNGSHVYDELLFLPPASIRGLLDSHVLRVSGKPKKIDGVSAVEVTPGQSQPANAAPADLWINPTNDEILRSVLPSGLTPEVNYHWLPLDSTNAAHLELHIPTGFAQVANTFVENGVPTSYLPPANASYQTALDSCATSSTMGLTIGASTTFTQLRAGSVGRIQWVLWFGGVSNGQPLLAMLGGSGATAQCIVGTISK